MGRGIVEVNRLCARRDVPAALRWNAASLLYGRAGRDSKPGHTVKLGWRWQDG